MSAATLARRQSRPARHAPAHGYRFAGVASVGVGSVPPMTMTPTRQQNAVSQGMAFGLLLCGRDSLPTNKVSVDLAFAGAWHSWPYARQFPKVDSDMRRFMEGYPVISRADAHKQAEHDGACDQGVNASRGDLSRC